MKLKRELGALEVFAIASGSMISSGLFVLPAMAYSKAGPSVFLAYLAAAFFILPALVTKAELATAMPKSGGDYFYIQRSLGPLFGTFAGLSTWLSIGLKSAFALVGIGVFLEPLLPGLGSYGVKIIAVIFTIVFILINIFSVKHSGRFQVYFVIGLLIIIGIYLIGGLPKIDVHNFVPFTKGPIFSFWQTAGLIFISYGGLTKVAAIAEEIKDPGRNIPLGMFSSYIVVSTLYVLSVFVTVGVMKSNVLSSSLTPLSDGAAVFLGKPGWIILSIAAMMAFITTANAGLMSASRSPLAMSEDHLIPGVFGRISIKYQTPVVSIITTGVFMILLIVGLDMEKLVKAASTMMLLLFLFGCIAVIVMRESKLPSYRPLFKIPLYPLVPILGIIIYSLLILAMGLIPLLITGAFLVVTLVWYFLYSKSRSAKDSAIIHMVEMASSQELQTESLSKELMGILRERDGIVEDRFDELIHEAKVIDYGDFMSKDEMFNTLSLALAEKHNMGEDKIKELFLAREGQSTTMITKGLAIPHIILPGENEFEIVVLRSIKGILFDEGAEPVHMVFALAGSENERNFHLQALMAIAQIVQNEGFTTNWLRARNSQELRQLILLAERLRRGNV
ncbi:amino acid permease [Spirochaeta cellobiosiphila]|uniref:amino acid permease n=1 Tax=Spirochaeta cellobiosiphila TaxID=504483 RepID=UPI0003F77229|nr:amino acid permease [Spirochaeta cellobiosiphila]